MRGQRWALFVSGRGSTAQAVMENMGQLNLCRIVSSKKNCMGLVRARRAGIPVTFMDAKLDWKSLDERLRREKVNRIFLLGFMKIIPADFVEAWKNRIVNVHPSLLPAYPGKEAMEKSYSDKVDMGVTVHIVTAEMDAGPPILKKKVFAVGKTQALDFEQVQLRMSFQEQNLVRRVSELERLSC